MEAKFGGGRDLPDNSRIMPILPPKVLETQDNLAGPEGEGDNVMLGAAI